MSNNMFYCSFVSIHYIICECGDTFPTEDALKKHLERDHNPKNENVETVVYKCDTCEKVFYSEEACLVHQRVHTKARLRIEPEDCEVNEKQLRKTYKYKHVVCEVCGKSYASNAALRYHQRVHTGERPYHCTMCPKSFTMPLFLQIHLRTHTGERPYQCPHCPKAFSNKAALLRHNRVHTGAKPYECPQCGKFFTQSNSMKLHVKTVHLKQPTPYKSKNRRNKQASRQAGMNVHVKIEEGVYQPAIKSEVHYEEVEPYEEVDDYNERLFQVYQDDELYQGVKVEGENIDGDIESDIICEDIEGDLEGEEHIQNEMVTENINAELEGVEVALYDESGEEVLYEEVYTVEEI